MAFLLYSHPDLLRCPCDRGKQGHQTGLVHLAAVAGKGAGAFEYSPLTLDTEYRRDVSKGLPIEIPRNYYVNDDPDKGPLVRWRGHANLLFSNWLNYFVYQETPYNIEDIR